MVPREEVTVINNSNSLPDSATVSNLQTSLAILSRQAIMQQFWQEQRTRSQGHSGVTDIRGWAQGDDDYNDKSWAGMSFHNHPNHMASSADASQRGGQSEGKEEKHAWAI